MCDRVVMSDGSVAIVCGRNHGRRRAAPVSPPRPPAPPLPEPGSDEALLATLEFDGLSLTARGDRLVVAPASALQPWMREAIAGARDDLLALVRQREAAPESAATDDDPDPLALHEPDFTTGPVYLVELLLVTIGGRTVVHERAKGEAFLAQVASHNAQAMERWRKRGAQ